MQLREFRKAVANFNEAIRIEPTEPDHFYKRGIAYLKLEEPQKAFNSFDLAILNDENNAEALRGAATALRLLGRDSLANEYQNKADALPRQTNRARKQLHQGRSCVERRSRPFSCADFAVGASLGIRFRSSRSAIISDTAIDHRFDDRVTTAVSTMPRASPSRITPKNTTGDRFSKPLVKFAPKIAVRVTIGKKNAAKTFNR